MLWNTAVSCRLFKPRLSENSAGVFVDLAATERTKYHAHHYKPIAE